jgi:hypothetical protein
MRETLNGDAAWPPFPHLRRSPAAATESADGEVFRLVSVVN